jgi:hypothetical protein
MPVVVVAVLVPVAGVVHVPTRDTRGRWVIAKVDCHVRHNGAVPHQLCDASPAIMIMAIVSVPPQQKCSRSRVRECVQPGA